MVLHMSLIFCCKQKTAYEMRISDWSSDVCSSDLQQPDHAHDEEGTEGREVALCRVATEAEAQEGRRRREEGLRDRGPREDEEDRRHRQAHYGRERPEEQLRGAGRKARDAEAQHHHECERREHDHIFEEPRTGSEERRVGKECVRTGEPRWTTDQEKKK